MKIALSSYSGYGAWFALRLQLEGHKVDYYLSLPQYQDILGGLVSPKIVKLDHRRNEVGFPEYKKYDLSLFDLTGRKFQANHSLKQCPTIGDGIWHCIMEDDRMQGIKMMEAANVNVPPYEEFADVNAAKSFIKKTDKRYVYKPNGGQDQDAATTYVSKSAEDLLQVIDKVFASSKGTPFVLQEFIEGTECSVEGWFNGQDFYCLNCTIEDKKFMCDNIGPNTGCSGNLVFTLGSKARIFVEGLEKCKNVLASIGFQGMIDLNSILTETQLYGLEWTPRFGYDASATLACMYGGDYGELLRRTASGEVPEQSWKAEFGASVRITIPPYPTEIRLPKLQGVPIEGIDLNDPEEMLKTYMYDVKVSKKDHLECAGVNGLLLCPIETGSSSTEAFQKLKARVKKIQVPDMQYRSDIQKSTLERYMKLDEQGWFSNG